MEWKSSKERGRRRRERISFHHPLVLSFAVQMPGPNVQDRQTSENARSPGKGEMSG